MHLAGSTLAGLSSPRAAAAAEQPQPWQQQQQQQLSKEALPDPQTAAALSTPLPLLPPEERQQQPSLQQQLRSVAISEQQGAEMAERPAAAAGVGLSHEPPQQGGHVAGPAAPEAAAAVGSTGAAAQPDPWEVLPCGLNLYEVSRVTAEIGRDAGEVGSC